MDITKTIAELKLEPGFQAKVGMLLAHNGVVRATSRDGRPVTRLDVSADQTAVERICREAETRPGIFRVLAEAQSGSFRPGEDLLHIIVAGDIRENVLETLAYALNRIKSETIKKIEHY